VLQRRALPQSLRGKDVDCTARQGRYGMARSALGQSAAMATCRRSGILVNESSWDSIRKDPVHSQPSPFKLKMAPSCLLSICCTAGCSTKILHSAYTLDAPQQYCLFNSLQLLDFTAVLAANAPPELSILCRRSICSRPLKREARRVCMLLVLRLRLCRRCCCCSRHSQHAACRGQQLAGQPAAGIVQR
jgi:hypothetical protein